MNREKSSEEAAKPYSRRVTIYGTAATFSAILTLGSLFGVAAGFEPKKRMSEPSNIMSASSLNTESQGLRPVFALCAFGSAVFASGFGLAAYSNAQVRDRKRSKSIYADLIEKNVDYIHNDFEELLDNYKITKKQKKQYLEISLNAFEKIIGKYDFDPKESDFQDGEMRREVDALFIWISRLPLELQKTKNVIFTPEV